MKRKFVRVMFLGALALSTVTYVGCKDYDDDIDNLQTQIDAIKVTLDGLKAKVDGGAVITGVTKGDDGIVVTLSDGNKYELTNGKDGAKGKDATVWTIGETDGYWYENGVKSKYKAVGTDGNNGSAGEQGPAGGDGKPGENGQYYVPNETTGCFDIYKDGKLVEATEISWKTAAEGGMTAILSGNELTLTGVEGVEEGGSVKILSGIVLSSVAFIPDVVMTDMPYATTSKPFYHIEEYLDETKYTKDTYDFIDQEDWDKSNVVDMFYRLNPEDANVTNNTIFGFIDRIVTTRAVGDNKTLLNVAEKDLKDGVATIGATINARELSAEDLERNIAALQAWYGQKPLTSDYVYATSEAIDFVLANTDETKTGDVKATVFYPRTKSIEKGETDEYVKSFVALNKAANISFAYNTSIDLNDYVGLYCEDLKEWLPDLGFKGITYEFTIPENYLANDDDKTNQQWFIVKDETMNGDNALTNGTIKVNPEVNNETPATGRTPIVRVDAFMTSNTGAKKLVASSYIKLSISEYGEKPVYDPINMAAPMAVDYHLLQSGYNAFDNADNHYASVSMGYQDINNKIYGTAHLTSTTFWNYYGGTDPAGKTYNVSLTVLDTDNKEKVLLNENVNQKTNNKIEQDGIIFNINLNNEATTTSAVKVGVNNKALTNHTYKDVDGKGARYTITITIASNDNSHGDIKLNQIFYVKENCTAYTYNPLYYKSSYTSLVDGKKYNDCIVVKGQIGVSDAWEMSSVVSEHFAKRENEDKVWENIFTYYNKVDNVEKLTFAWTAEKITDVTPIIPFTTDQTVKLTTAMTQRDIVKNMGYTKTLVNGEECKTFDYNIVFLNPFVAGAAKEVVVEDRIGESTGETMPQVLVKDNSTETIYSYDSKNKKLALSDIATGTYKLTSDIVSVTYAFDKTTAAWKELDGNKSDDSILEVSNDEKDAGKVTWKNQGALLQKDYALTVVATVTFKDLSVVKCNIPVRIAKK